MFRLAAVMFLILMANQSLAQEIPKQSPAPMSQGFTMFIGVPCDNRENILKIITDKYNERPFTKGTGTMTVAPQNVQLPGIVKVWANPETWSFSITIEDPNPANDVMCLLTSGKDLQPTSAEQEGDNL